MYKILKKKSLNPTVTMMEIEAPLVAAKAEPGQFIILRVDGEGESNLPADIKRARYFRGHGVHSPFVYAIVREVFMQSKLRSNNRELYEELLNAEVSKRRATQLQNLMEQR